MGHQNTTEHINKARTEHLCSWCNEKIKKGKPYSRWRWFDNGDTSVVKVHPECLEALNVVIAERRDCVEFNPGDNPRGCNCGFSKGCERCSA